jgi:predicted lipoprotein with Yx(FWY)xxD motif
MRPDLQQDPRPEFGIPVPSHTGVAGRHDATSGPQGPWSGPQPAAGPWTGSTPMPGPYSGPQPAVGPYSGQQPAAPRPATTGSYPAADRAPAGFAARQSAEPTVRHQQRAETPPYEPTAYESAPTEYDSGRYDTGRSDAGRYDSGRYEAAGYDRRDGHPSGPLPVGSGHRRGTERRAGAGRGRRRMLLALVAAGAVVVGAAGYVGIAKWGATSDQATAPAAAAAPAAATSLTGPNLATKQTPLGLVATSDGFTVYEYTKDTNKPSVSNCSGSCATSWPPVLAGDTPWLKGVSADKVGTVDRSDGSKQLTLNGWPLYRYAKDAQPGDTTGNGVGGTWKALNPDGKPVAGNASAAGGTAPAAAGSGSSGSEAGTGAASGGSGSAYGSAGSGGGAASPAPAAPAASGDSYGSSGY